MPQLLRVVTKCLAPIGRGKSLDALGPKLAFWRFSAKNQICALEMVEYSPRESKRSTQTELACRSLRFLATPEKSVHRDPETALTRLIGLAPDSFAHPTAQGPCGVDDNQWCEAPKYALIHLPLSFSFEYLFFVESGVRSWGQLAQSSTFLGNKNCASPHKCPHGGLLWPRPESSIQPSIREFYLSFSRSTGRQKNQ